MNPTFRRFLLCSLLPATVSLGYVEWRSRSHPDPKRHIGAGARKSPKIAQVLTELDPHSREGNHLLGMEAFELFVQVEVDEQHFAEQAYKRFRRALAVSEKDDEQLHYLHAVMLVVLDADPKEIDAAIAAWRRNFPRTAMAEDPHQYVAKF